MKINFYGLDFWRTFSGVAVFKLYLRNFVIFFILVR